VLREERKLKEEQIVALEKEVLKVEERIGKMSGEIESCETAKKFIEELDSLLRKGYNIDFKSGIKEKIERDRKLARIKGRTPFITENQESTFDDYRDEVEENPIKISET